MNPKKYFISFADSRMEKTLKRIALQAKKMKIYDSIEIFTEKNLTPDFKNKFKDKLVLGSRGYGYWCWKPQVILQTFEKMQEGDLLQYSDAGCHLNKKGFKRLKEYFSIVQENKKGILAFQFKPLFGNEIEKKDISKNKEFHWIKGDLLDYFKMRRNQKILNSGTIWAGTIFLKKTEYSQKFLKEWLEIFKNNFELLDDSESKSLNLPSFKENRHDQSAFSILCKIGRIKTLSAYETWYPSERKTLFHQGRDWKKIKNFPIHAKRDKNLGFKEEIKKINEKVLNTIKNF
ncbi:MAG: hypothetical protein U9Q99_01340 [Nanoarchaeota archaeon]|nr:hypothetical protein [Nanoarchaeota archaeon]